MPKKLKRYRRTARISNDAAVAEKTHGRLHRIGSGGTARAVDPNTKISNLHRLKRIEGQIRGLHDMVEQDRYCADILIQISAVHKSLASVARKLLGHHLKHCVSHNIRAGGALADAAYEELLQLVCHIDR